MSTKNGYQEIRIYGTLGSGKINADMGRPAWQ
jgi:hypothetical protein